MPLIPIIGLAFLGLVGTIALLYFGLRGSDAPDEIQTRLDEYASRSNNPLSLEEIELSLPFSQRVLQPMLRQLAGFLTKFTPAKTIEATRHKLELAGKPFNWGEREFLGLRVLAAILFGLLGFLILSIARQPMPKLIGGTAFLCFIGLFLPNLWISSKIRRRQEEILKAMPDSLDLLTISAEAGLGFDAAMAKVAEKWDNELCRGFGRVIHEIRLGKSRREALRNMDERMEVNDVKSFVAAIIQADQLGVSIAKVMRVQSEQMRIRRRQRAEEKAHQAPIKMLFPMVFLIFPSLFIVLLGPAVLQIMASGVFNALGKK